MNFVVKCGGLVVLAVLLFISMLGFRTDFSQEFRITSNYSDFKAPILTQFVDTEQDRIVYNATASRADIYSDMVHDNLASDSQQTQTRKMYVLRTEGMRSHYEDQTEEIRQARGFKLRAVDMRNRHEKKMLIKQQESEQRILESAKEILEDSIKFRANRCDSDD